MSTSAPGAGGDRVKDIDDSESDDDAEEGAEDDEDDEDDGLDSDGGVEAPGADQDTAKNSESGGPARGGGRKWDNSRENSQENDITHESEDENIIAHGSSGEVLLRHKATQRPSTLLGQPGILVAVMGGAVVGLLLAILCVMFVVYRMRKKDEGSYPLGKRNHDDHFSTHRRNYMRPSANKEFYA
ncbi:hypothetical protein BIW11_10530 [Tropilaelaps mercedesae]|uniref:Syndecan n=1 Tax=Tropilaelaps mercedesae TaxID=418985 RepID=A0A1V9XF80_9ACAR|nr:hypothetical protein BIW11_10530 [Tropilaelaps mercedesae]